MVKVPNGIETLWKISTGWVWRMNITDRQQTWYIYDSIYRTWMCHVWQKIVRCHEWIGWLNLNFVKIIPNIAQHVTHVQDDKVKYCNRSNFTADCSILLIKFDAEFDDVTAIMLQMSKVNRSRSQGQRSGSQGQRSRSQGQRSRSQGQRSRSQGQRSGSPGQRSRSQCNVTFEQ